MHCLHALDVLAHAVVAQLVAQQGEAFFYEGGRRMEKREGKMPESNQSEGFSTSPLLLQEQVKQDTHTRQTPWHLPTGPYPRRRYSSIDSRDAA